MFVYLTNEPCINLILGSTIIRVKLKHNINLCVIFYVYAYKYLKYTYIDLRLDWKNL